MKDAACLDPKNFSRSRKMGFLQQHKQDSDSQSDEENDEENDEDVLDLDQVAKDAMCFSGSGLDVCQSCIPCACKLLSQYNMHITAAARLPLAEHNGDNRLSCGSTAVPMRLTNRVISLRASTNPGATIRPLCAAIGQATAIAYGCYYADPTV
ncbi:hypothetical protein ACJJTC_003538 [Scirpophaga incertulas]